MIRPPGHSRQRSLPLDPPLLVFALLLFAAVGARVAWLSVPPTQLIFDEAYYVNASRIILGIPVAEGSPYADQPLYLDPNREHPPLGKLLIAGSMRVLGDDPWGWRLPSEVAGLASILLLYGIVRSAGGDRWLGVLAAGLFAADNLSLVHSRIGTLDMILVAFMLLGAWCSLRGWRLTAGIALGLATLVKIGGLYGLAAILLFEAALAGREWLSHRTRPWGRIKPMAALVAIFGIVWIGGLWVLDSRFSTYTTPWDHIKYILDYGLTLTRQNGPANTESNPWQWLINEVQIPYLRVDEQVLVNGQVSETRATINFRGAMNPVIICSASLGMAFAAWRAWRADDRVSLWTVAWIVGTYLPFFPLALITHRISYIFYFLPTLPAVAVGLALLLRHGGLPRVVVGSYLVAVLLGFVMYYPYQRIPP